MKKLEDPVFTFFLGLGILSCFGIALCSVLYIVLYKSTFTFIAFGTIILLSVIAIRELTETLVKSITGKWL